MTAFTTWLDRLTGRVTMYRLVLICLLALVVEALIAGALGRISYSPGAILLNGAVAVVATVVSNRLIALAFRVKPHTESSVVTALILLFLFLPQLTLASVEAIALAGVIASVSKYVLAFRQRHVFNPAAVSAVVMSIAVPSAFPGWWVGAPWLLPVTLVAAFVILYRTRHLTMGIVFAVIATASVAFSSASNGADTSTAIVNALTSTPVLFFAGFMLSEPLTLPPRRWQQIVEAVIVGVLFGLTFHIGPVYLTYELALVIGNLLAFFVGQRRGIKLVFVGRERLTPTSWELSFRPKRPVAFRAGQFMELSLPHARADVRGQRRVFSIASDSGSQDLVRFGLKTATPSSSFKTALLGLEPGDTISGTGVGGDFVLPSDTSRPLLLVAGGIGITPFASQLASAKVPVLAVTGGVAAAPTPSAADRDIVLVYSVSSPDEIAYREALADAGVRTLLVAPTAPDDLPGGWTYVGPGPLTPDHLANHVPDAATRHAYVSGSPRLVHSVRRSLRHSGVRRITTDAFSGY